MRLFRLNLLCPAIQGGLPIGCKLIGECVSHGRASTSPGPRRWSSRVPPALHLERQGRLPCEHTPTVRLPRATLHGHGRPFVIRAATHDLGRSNSSMAIISPLWRARDTPRECIPGPLQSETASPQASHNRLPMLTRNDHGQTSHQNIRLFAAHVAATLRRLSWKPRRIAAVSLLVREIVTDLEYDRLLAEEDRPCPKKRRCAQRPRRTRTILWSMVWGGGHDAPGDGLRTGPRSPGLCHDHVRVPPRKLNQYFSAESPPAFEQTHRRSPFSSDPPSASLTNVFHNGRHPEASSRSSRPHYSDGEVIAVLVSRTRLTMPFSSRVYLGRASLP